MISNNNLILPNSECCTVGIIGLGYVGLPLAIEIARNKKCFFSGRKINREVIGLDINHKRIDELKNSKDITNSVENHNLKNLTNLHFTTEPLNLTKADFYIITVPTPIDKNNQPDLSALKKASIAVGEIFKMRTKKSIPVVIFESTVFPGATEEICIPLIEKYSGYNSNNRKNDKKTFYYGYSPERVNPGDTKRGISEIIKLTSGNNSEAAKLVDILYKSFIKAGTYKVNSIKIAEAAKVIENTQRDLNIALVNELALIFDHMNIDTNDVLDAAGTKWNFLKFRPGLVGGHCIGIDPYYLTFKAAEYGYHANLVLSGRSTNEKMSRHIADKLIINLCNKKINISQAKVLIMGCSFKENCPDIRNSKVFDLVKRLEEFSIVVDITDPIASNDDIKNSYDYELKKEIDYKSYDAIIVAVSHKEYKNKQDYFWLEILNAGIIIFDVKNILPRNKNILRL
tara:strand:- start:809 stop:2176 length:1368 start_codon:yes stop_codon:yes gene_type:complete